MGWNKIACYSTDGWIDGWILPSMYLNNHNNIKKTQTTTTKTTKTSGATVPSLNKYK